MTATERRQEGRDRRLEQDGHDRAGRQAGGTPWLEWAASGVGLVLTSAVIGFVGWKAWNADDMPPFVTVDVERVVESASGYAVVVRVRNPTSSTAAHVEIQGELKRDGKTVETGSMTFDYVPGQSERKGGLLFEQDPRPLAIEVRATGYTRP